MSSEVGRPRLFWRWSNMIFRMAPCVASSYSSIFLEESTLVVSMRSLWSASLSTEAHHVSRVLSKVTTIDARPEDEAPSRSSVQTLLSASTRSYIAPRTLRSPTARSRAVAVMRHRTSFARVAGGTSNVTVASRSVCVHVCVDATPPFPTGTCVPASVYRTAANGSSFAADGAAGLGAEQEETAGGLVSLFFCRCGGGVSFWTTATSSSCASRSRPLPASGLGAYRRKASRTRRSAWPGAKPAAYDSPTTPPWTT
mmetsp:Transcript_15223/g.61205  ORF Transcript_15223/g.61205 Transcript_15223/m.61205 type:complete len:255 (-) Transcript_15223:140-904(-)